MTTMTAPTSTKNKLRTVDLAYAAVFAALMMIGANIVSFMPFFVIAGVPITLQTFFAVLAGVLLGSRLGAISMTVYMLIGLIGLPVFAQFKGGFAMAMAPTFGFIVSFIFVAWIVGKMVENKKDIKTFIIAALVGTAINYVFGTTWMYLNLKYVMNVDITYLLAWVPMMAPLPKDIILAVFAGIFGLRMKKTLRIGR